MSRSKIMCVVELESDTVTPDIRPQSSVILNKVPKAIPPSLF